MEPTRAFTVRDARARGWSDADLRARELAIPARGARVIGSEGDRRADLIEALRALARDDQFFSHTTAARIHGMPLPPRLRDDAIHLASPSLATRMRRRGVRGHRIKAEVVARDGLRVESIADTFIHLASMLQVDELVAVGDWILMRGTSAADDIAALEARCRHFKGARGLGVVRRALGRMRRGAESAQETRTRLLVVDAGLPEPTLQHEVFDASGTFVARLDMAWPDLLVGLEYDGQHHRVDSRQYARDLERHNLLQAAGWTVVRVTKHELEGSGRKVVELTRQALASARGASGR